MLTRRNFLLGSAAIVAGAALPALALGRAPVWFEAGDEQGEVLIARFVYWNKRLSDEQLRVMTA